MKDLNSRNMLENIVVVWRNYDTGENTIKRAGASMRARIKNMDFCKWQRWTTIWSTGNG
ncbi:MAG: hypothetical protein RR131_09670 [Anaerovorax sp.]